MSIIAERLLEARRHYPEVFPSKEPKNADEVADAALRGVVLFFGREPIEVGRRNIDWSGGHRRHQEFPAQLNRFFQLDALRWKYLQTKDERYAHCARDYIEDWIDQHDYSDAGRPSAPGDRTLDMAIRLGGLRFPGWFGVLPDFTGSEAFEAAFAEKMVRSADGQLKWLSAHLPPRGNWRVAALDCLFSQAMRLPERFGGFRGSAVEGLNAEFTWQILPDGAHLERSAGYHSWMCQVFLKLWKLSRAHPELGLSLDDERVVRMHSYTLHLTKPNGAPCGFNDARSTFRTSANGAGVLEKALETQKNLRKHIGVEEETVPQLGLFQTAGYVFYRTGWGADDVW